VKRIPPVENKEKAERKFETEGVRGHLRSGHDEGTVLGKKGNRIKSSPTKKIETREGGPLGGGGFQSIPELHPFARAKRGRAPSGAIQTERGDGKGVLHFSIPARRGAVERGRGRRKGTHHRLNSNFKERKTKETRRLRI